MRFPWPGSVALRCVAAASFLLVGPECVAHAGSQSAAEASPNEVTVGMYLRDIPEVDLRAGVFSFDAYVWLRWDPAGFLADGTAAGPASGLPRSPADTHEVMGVHELQSTAITSRPGYAVFRVQGKIRQSFDLSRFPLDRHLLAIRIQDSESEVHRVRYVPDVEGSKAGQLSLHGWSTGPLVASSSSEVFPTNFGDASLPTGTSSVYSEVCFGLDLYQSDRAYFFKLNCTAFIAAGLALLALLIRPSDVDPRFGLPVGGLFAAIASEWIVCESLPDRSGLTIADWIHVLTFLWIFLVVLVSVVSLRMYEAGRESDALRTDRVAFSVLLPCYVAGCILVMLR